MAPDGRHICYTRVGGGATEVAVIPSTGGLPVVVSAKGSLSESGIWSPRSDRLAYVTFPDDGAFEIWVAPIASPASRRPVLRSRELAWPLFWSKDGREIVIARGRGPEWYFNAVTVETGAETRIGKMVPLPSGRNHIAELLPAGEKHRELFFPGGEVILADGKDSGDIYLVRARPLVASGRLAARVEDDR
jgi:Tol biopolymer transport system component